LLSSTGVEQAVRGVVLQGIDEFRLARNPLDSAGAERPQLEGGSWHPYRRFIRLLQHLDQRFDRRAVYDAGAWVARFHAPAQLHEAPALRCRVNEALRPWPKLFRGAQTITAQTVDVGEVRFKLAARQQDALHRLFVAGWLRERLVLVNLETIDGLADAPSSAPGEHEYVVRPKNRELQCCGGC
jgi:hypothetical protein